MNRHGDNANDGEATAAGDLVVPLLEEEVRVEKRQVSTGKVRIRSVVEEFQQSAEATLQGERVEVVRVPIDRVVEQAPSVRTEDGVTIVPVLEEVLFVEKRLVLKEELHIRRHATTETVDMPVRLKRQRAVVERLADAEYFNENEESI